MKNYVKTGLLFVPFMTGKGGTERVIENLYDTMQNENFNSYFVMTTVSIGGSDNYDWAKKIPLKIINAGKTRLIRKIFYVTCLPVLMFFLILNRKTDFIISTNPVMWTLAKISCKILRRHTKVISWYHYSLKQKPVKPFLLNTADAYLAISSGIKEQLIQNGIKENRIFLVFNPVVSDGKIVKRPQDKVHFLYVGRMDLDGQKNLRELFQALARVSGNWELDTYGDETYIEDIVKVTKDLSIDKNVVHHGFVDNLWDKVNVATALVLTSKYEGLPMVLCEAVSHGVFCISSDVDTGPRDIINKNNGKLYRSGDTEELCMILQNIVDQWPMPDGTTVKATAKKFEPQNYMMNFFNAITTTLKGK